MNSVIMSRARLILLGLTALLGACSGGRALEKELEYGSLTGAIPENSVLSTPGTGNN